MLYLICITAALLIGIVILLLCSRPGRLLRRRSEAIGVFRGMYYEEILVRFGLVPHRITERADGKVLRMWQEGNYSISLLFDHTGLCLGVEDERTEDKAN